MSAHEEIMAQDLYDQGYRLHGKRMVDGHTVYVLTKDDKVTDVIVKQEPAIFTAAFKKGSWADNFSKIQGWVDGEKMVDRSVEIPVFMQVKLHEAIYQVKNCTDDEMRMKLVKSMDAIPKAVQQLLEKKPALDREDDQVVQVCKKWPKEEIDGGLPLEDLKKKWLERHMPLLDCVNTDPMIAKLGVGRGLPIEFLGRFFETDMANTAIAYTRSALLMGNKTLYQMAATLAWTEEMSHDDDKWAAKIVPKSDEGLLDFFKNSDKECDELRAAVVKHMLADGPQRLLGKCNLLARDIVRKALIEYVAEPPGMLTEIGWDKWWNLNQGNGAQEIFKPAPLFRVDGYVVEPIDFEAVLTALGRK